MRAWEIIKGGGVDYAEFREPRTHPNPAPVRCG